MSSRLLPPPPLTAPIPWKAAPWSSPLIVIDVACGAGPLCDRLAADWAPAAELAPVGWAAAGWAALSASASTGIRAAVAVAIQRPRPVNQQRIGCAAPCSACGRGWSRRDRGTLTPLYHEW